MTAKNEKTRKKNISDGEGIWVFVNVLKWKCLKTTKQMEGRNHSLIQYKYMNETYTNIHRIIRKIYIKDWGVGTPIGREGLK